MKLDIYTTKGTKKGSAEMSDMVFGATWNADLVHQVVTAMQSNQRQGSAHTKNRGEVSGGGKKPWRQKGTGRARHGSSRSPIWIGGGTTFGPRSDKNYSRDLNKKVKIKSLYTVLSAKMANNSIVGVDTMDSTTISTKAVSQALTSLAKAEGLKTLLTKNAHNVLLVIPTHSDLLVKSVRNMPQVDMVTADMLNTLEVMQSRYIILVNPEEVNTKLVARHWSSPKVPKEKKETEAGEKMGSKTKKTNKKSTQKASKKSGTKSATKTSSKAAKTTKAKK